MILHIYLFMEEYLFKKINHWKKNIYRYISMTIHKIFTIEEPSSRYSHSAVKNNGKQADIFGGCNIGKKNERNLNDWIK